MTDKKNLTQMVFRSLLAPVLMFALLFITAGRMDYWQGWLYLVINCGFLIYMAFNTPNKALIAERLNPGKGMKRWDKVYFAITTPLYISALIISGAEVRFGGLNVLPVWAVLAGVLLYCVGQGIFLWARHTNQYFSSVVRIQTERGHTVCKEGPYRFVRHPGYVGGILFTIAIPLMLGSIWGLIPQGLAVLLMIVRTALEDKTLQAELPGYLEFTRGTRYRLLPGVW